VLKRGFNHKIQRFLNENREKNVLKNAQYMNKEMQEKEHTLVKK